MRFSGRRPLLVWRTSQIYSTSFLQLFLLFAAFLRFLLLGVLVCIILVSVRRFQTFRFILLTALQSFLMSDPNCIWPDPAAPSLPQPSLRVCVSAASLPSWSNAEREARVWTTPPSSSRSGRAWRVRGESGGRTSSGRWPSCSRSSIPTSSLCTTSTRTAPTWCSSWSCEWQHNATVWLLGEPHAS